jgi:hypothetical protein
MKLFMVRVGTLRSVGPLILSPLAHHVEDQMPNRNSSKGKYFSRYEVVESAKPTLKEFTKNDLRYLVGRRCEYKTLNEAHHSCELRAVATYTERHMKDKSKQRQQATLKMFVHVTGYDTYKAAYTNHKETRILSRHGLYNETVSDESEGEGGEGDGDKWLSLFGDTLLVVKLAVSYLGSYFI